MLIFDRRTSTTVRQKRDPKKFMNKKAIRLFLEYFGWDDIIALILGIVGILFYILIGLKPEFPAFFTFYERIHIELISISITVLILGNADQYIRTKLEKKSLILQMGSSDKGFATEAVRQLRQRGWLEDGICKGEIFDGANLTGVDLGNADLENAHFFQVNLNSANLICTNLAGVFLFDSDLEMANMSNANLERADLREANLEKAIFYKAHLEGTDLRDTNLDRACLMNATYNGKTLWPEGFDPKEHRFPITDMDNQ